MLLVIDVSGSMGDPAGATGTTKLDLGQGRRHPIWKSSRTTDDVGLRIFSTDISRPTRCVLHRPGADRGDRRRQRENLAATIDDLVPERARRCTT